MILTIFCSFMCILHLTDGVCLVLYFVYSLLCVHRVESSGMCCGLHLMNRLIRPSFFPSVRPFQHQGLFISYSFVPRFSVVCLIHLCNTLIYLYMHVYLLLKTCKYDIYQQVLMGQKKMLCLFSLDSTRGLHMHKKWHKRSLRHRSTFRRESPLSLALKLAIQLHCC